MDSVVEHSYGSIDGIEFVFLLIRRRRYRRHRVHLTHPLEDRIAVQVPRTSQFEMNNF